MRTAAAALIGQDANHVPQDVAAVPVQRVKGGHDGIVIGTAATAAAMPCRHERLIRQFLQGRHVLLQERPVGEGTGMTLKRLGHDAPQVIQGPSACASMVLYWRRHDARALRGGIKGGLLDGLGLPQRGKHAQEHGG